MSNKNGGSGPDQRRVEGPKKMREVTEKWKDGDRREVIVIFPYNNNIACNIDQVRQQKEYTFQEAVYGEIFDRLSNRCVNYNSTERMSFWPLTISRGKSL